MRQGRLRRQPAVASVSLAPTRWDMGADGPANRRGLVQEDATDMDPTTGKPQPNPNGVKRMRRVNMIDVWHAKGEISTAGFNAAEKLRNAYERTQCAPGWPDNDRVQASSRPDLAVAMQVDRRTALGAIWSRVHRDDERILWCCVVEARTPAKCGYDGARYRAGMAHLRAALDRLAHAMG